VTWRSPFPKVEAEWRRSQRDLWAAARALSAYQRCEVDEDGQPTQRHMVGAMLHAEHYHIHRELMRGLSKK
jgi:hypothetical protein